MIVLLQVDNGQETCKKCPDEFKDKPLLGLKILKNFTFENNFWINGTILVPKTGKKYRYHSSADNNGALVIGGFIGFLLLRRSTYWHRVES